MPSNSKKMRNNEASRNDAKSEIMVPTHTREGKMDRDSMCTKLLQPL
jgi:hypothetical protein